MVYSADSLALEIIFYIIITQLNYYFPLFRLRTTPVVVNVRLTDIFRINYPAIICYRILFYRDSYNSTL